MNKGTFSLKTEILVKITLVFWIWTGGPTSVLKSRTRWPSGPCPGMYTTPWFTCFLFCFVDTKYKYKYKYLLPKQINWSSIVLIYLCYVIIFVWFIYNWDVDLRDKDVQYFPKHFSDKRIMIGKNRKISYLVTRISTLRTNYKTSKFKTPFFSSPTAAQLSERSKKLLLNFSIGCSIFLPCRICIKSPPIGKKSQMMFKKFST